MTRISSAKDQMSKKSTTTSNMVWIVYTVLIFFALVAIVSLFTYESQLQKHQPDLSSANSAQTYLYQLTGDPTWIEDRVWEVRDVSSNEILTTSTSEGEFVLTDSPPGTEFTVSNPDWEIKFMGQTGVKSQASFDFSLGRAPIQLPLDKKLDTFARSFVNNFNQQNWTNLAITVDPSSLPLDQASDSTSSASSDQFLSVSFNNWLNGLQLRNFSLDNINVFYNLNRDRSMAGKLVLLWTFTNRTTQEKTTMSSNLELVKTNDPENPYQWVFDTSTFPRPASEAF